jgi:hypothetical protein
VRIANERHDTAQAAKIEEGLERLEPSLDQLIQRRQGQLS